MEYTILFDKDTEIIQIYMDQYDISLEEMAERINVDDDVLRKALYCQPIPVMDAGLIKAYNNQLPLWG